MNKFAVRLVALVAVIILGLGVATHWDRGPLAAPGADPGSRNLYLKQLENNDDVPRQIQADYARRNQEVAAGVMMGLGGSMLVGLGLGQMICHRRASRRKPFGTPEL